MGPTGWQQPVSNMLCSFFIISFLYWPIWSRKGKKLLHPQKCCWKAFCWCQLAPTTDRFLISDEEHNFIHLLIEIGRDSLLKNGVEIWLNWKKSWRKLIVSQERQLGSDGKSKVGFIPLSFFPNYLTLIWIGINQMRLVDSRHKLLNGFLSFLQQNLTNPIFFLISALISINRWHPKTVSNHRLKCTKNKNGWWLYLDGVVVFLFQVVAHLAECWHSPPTSFHFTRTCHVQTERKQNAFNKNLENKPRHLKKKMSYRRLRGIDIASASKWQSPVTV